MKTKHKDQISEAVCHLASACDGAIKNDNRGFNAFDSDFGKTIANRIRSGNVTDKQLFAAYKMIKKYRKQLNQAGITIPDNINGSSHKPKKRQPKIDVDGAQVLIFFGGRPSQDDRNLLDKLTFRRWNPNIKGLPWETNLSYIKQVNDLFGNRENWQYSQSYLDALKNAPEKPSETPERPRIDTNGELMLIYFGGRPTDYNRKLLDQFSQRTWDPDRNGKPWVVPVRLIEDVFRIFEHAEFTQEAKAELQKRRQLAEMSRNAESNFEVPGLKGTLFPYQAAGVEFIETANGRACLADDMGLGKTIQAIAYMQLHPDCRPAIIVCPASLKINWSREIEKWLSDNSKVSILAGRTVKPEMLDANVFIINYEILSFWVDALIELNPQIVIVDEAHKCKNPKTQRTKAVRKLSKVAKSFIPMTGTPIRNKPMELYAQLNMIAPGDWNNWYKYATRYNNYVRGYGLGTPANLDELHELIKPYVIRRTKQEVLKELPEKLRTTIVLEFNKKERQNYISAIVEAQNRTDNHLAIIEAAKQAAARGKLKAALGWISEFLESDEKLIVFANHREIVRTIYEHFEDRSVMLYGGMTQNKRQESVDRFQNDETVRLFVGNLDAAGVGITLTAASNVAIIEFPWTPDTLEQAIDRCHRIGQLNSVTAYYMVAEKTIEEDIVALLQEKAETIYTVMDKGHVDKEFSILDKLSKIIKTQTENITKTLQEKQS